MTPRVCIVYPPWTCEELEIVRSNLNQISYADIARQLPRRTLDAVKQRATLMGLPREGIHFPKRTLRDDFFRVPTHLSSYWAGFLAADGCVITEPRTELRLGLHSRDIEHMRLFMRDIGFDGHIRIDKNNCCHMGICAAYQVVDDLRDVFNIGPRKTFTLEPPNISGEMALAYSVGMIDGDGCWSTDQQVGSRRLILVVVGTASLLRWLIATWKEAGANIGDPNITFKRNVWRLALHKSKAEEVARILLPVETPKLDRKWRVARREADGQEVSKKRI